MGLLEVSKKQIILTDDYKALAFQTKLTSQDLSAFVNKTGLRKEMVTMLTRTQVSCGFFLSISI